MMERFAGMTKMPPDPAAKLLSYTNTILETQITSPVSATCDVVLAELAAKEDTIVDMLRLMAIMLPARERVWWACLAARDVVGPKSDKDPASLTTSEDWVFDPSPENRERARASLDDARVDDDTVNCAQAVLYFDGTLGPADLAEFPAPAGLAEICAFTMNVVALGEHSDMHKEYGQMLIDRGVDIARGGNGHVEKPTLAEETE